MNENTPPADVPVAEIDGAPVRMLSKLEARAVDAALGLIELPPIRLADDVVVALTSQALQRGLLLQAHVRDILATAAAADDVRKPIAEDDWLDIAEAHASLDWNSEQEDGFLDAVKSVGRSVLSAASRASAPPTVTALQACLRELTILNKTIGWRDGEWPIITQARTTLDALALPVHGDVLPEIGSRVLIRHGRDDDDHPCTVTGLYAWSDLGGDPSVQRVFVHVVYEGTTTPNARSLCDLRRPDGTPFVTDRREGTHQ